MKQWVRVASNRSLGAYEVHTRKKELEDPTWPELSLKEILEIAFEDRIITELDHPISESLEGGGMIFTSNRYREIWAVDFEFHFDGIEGNRPRPVCLVAKEFITGRKVRLWRDQFEAVPPYSVDQDSLFIAYYAPAEMSCHLALSWPIPPNIIDLYAEFRNLTNGLSLPHGKGLIGALSFFNLPNIGVLKKDSTRDLILTCGPWNQDQKAEILEYCESDVDALRLLSAEIIPKIDIGQALLRGRFSAAVAQMEHNGIPVDAEYLKLVKSQLGTDQNRICSEIYRRVRNIRWYVVSCREF